MKKEFDSYRNYVCPTCFNQLHKCTCDTFPPYSLLFIDENIQEHIRILKTNGFLTTGCCEGHHNSYSTEPYIAFGMDYVFDSLPYGFKWNKRRKMLVSNKISAKNAEEYNKIKKIRLKTLMEWAMSVKPKSAE